MLNSFAGNTQTKSILDSTRKSTQKIKDTIVKDIIALDYKVEDTIFQNTEKFSYNIYAENKLFKSNRFNIGVYADEIWKLKKTSVNEPWEFYFRNQQDRSYAFFYSEDSSGFDLNDANKLILKGIRGVMTNAEIIKSEYRIVNGLNVLYLVIKGKIKKFEFVLLNYVFKNSEALIQLSVLTKPFLLKKYQSDYENFLNGLVLLK